MDMISISAFDLMLAASLVVLLAIMTASTGRGLARNMLIAAVRTTVQLLLIGLVLKTVFASSNFGWVMLIVMVMLLAAGREVMARQHRRFSGWWSYGMGVLSMFLSSFMVMLFALLVIIGPQPWYEPQYAIPLMGMVLGNTMTGIAVSLDGLTRQAWEQRETIEARLIMGHNWREATTAIRRQSLHSGLIPIINAMAAAGIVSLPGMMTGQILAGASPVEAVKYQILIMFLIAAGTGFGTLSAVWLGSRRLFDERQRLRLDRLSTPR